MKIAKATEHGRVSQDTIYGLNHKYLDRVLPVCIAAGQSSYQVGDHITATDVKPGQTVEQQPWRVSHHSCGFRAVNLRVTERLSFCFVEFDSVDQAGSQHGSSLFRIIARMIGEGVTCRHKPAQIELIHQ